MAVASEDGDVTREVNTGLAERDANMVKFAEEALKLLLEVLNGEVKLEKASL